MPINWQLGIMPNIGATWLKAYEEGRTERALKDFAADPSNPQSVNALLALSPDIGFKALNYQRQLAKDKSDAATDNAVSDFVLASRGLAPNGAPAQAVAPNALLQIGTQQPATQTPTMGNPLPGAKPADPVAAKPDAPDLSFLGEPRTGADRAFVAMVRRDPKRALQIDSLLRDNMVKRLRAEHDFFDFAVSRLAGVTDEASYQSAITDAERILAPLGGDVRGSVPPSYPGPEGIEQLRLRALGSKDQLSYLLQESNIEADNERQDRNTASLITDRTERRNEQRRYNTERLDISRDRTKIYGNRAARAGQSGRSFGGGRSAAPVKVSTPAEAAKLPKGTRYVTPDGRVMVR